MAAYLDSSALVKLVVAEPESEKLGRFLRRHPVRISSALARVEVLRAVRFQGRPATHRAGKVLARIRLLRIDDALLEVASALDPRVLRSLDAIHLASAQALGTELGCVVTYDRRMCDAAGVLGLPVRSPGAPGDRPPRRPRATRAHRRRRPSRRPAVARRCRGRDARSSRDGRQTDRAVGKERSPSGGDRQK